MKRKIMNEFVTINRSTSDRKIVLNDLQFGEYFERYSESSLLIKLDYFDTIKRKCYNFNTNSFCFIDNDEIVYKINNVIINYKI
jgi:hypothetical protein